jgi:hypothetical protein
MSKPALSGLVEKAVLFAFASNNNFGEPQVSAGVEIKARWEIENGETLGPRDTVIKTVAIVLVDRDIEVGSLLWNGALVDLPSPVTELYKVADFNKVQDLKKRLPPTRYVRVTKFSDTMPTIV